MEIADITKVAGAKKGRKRVGRGRGSGHGKTSTRGHKGCGQRSGGGTRRLTEGGQMPFFRRLPKRGFSNAKFKIDYDVVNVSALDKAFDSGVDVTKQLLVEAGLIRHDRCLVKILGTGELSKELSVHADKFSRTAIDKIVKAGGSAKELKANKQE